jgi:proteasome lid subunit RPN8/RPN11
VNDDIQFGEVETARPQKQLRPDQNRHFSVVTYGAPRDGELPIFVELDVVADMELHAASDTSVELGGVLLGAQCEDEEGRPFVLITDSLRAEHYHSTKGSFTFTHETWAAITRRRDEFPEDLAMVGWYHTHPDWGVFLSGMDMFICDHFFNKRLDVAYVIDPCRGDRAFFQWTGDPRHRKRRVGGFYVVASRFRQFELETFVAQLEAKGPVMPATTSGYPAPIIQVPPSPPQPPWQPIAVLAMLALQFCFLALLAWKMFDGSSDATAELHQTLKEFVAAQEEAKERFREREEIRQRAYDRILAELKGMPEGTAGRIADDAELMELLRNEAPRIAARERELEELLQERTRAAADLAARLERTEASLQQLRDKTDKLAAANKELEAKLKPAEQKDKSEGEPAEEAQPGIWERYLVWWVVGGTMVVLTGAAALFYSLRRPEPALSDEESLPPPNPRPKNDGPAAK